jgi:uncharacterized membrane protein
VEPLVQTGFFALHDRFWARYDGREQARKPARSVPCVCCGLTAGARR